MPEDPHPPVTFAELHGEIARRDQRITELFGALTALVMWWDAGDEPGAVRIAPRAIWDNARNALGWPQPDPDLDLADLRITYYDPSGASVIDPPGRGVSILHIPSGWGTTCHSERSQLQNKAQALKALKARVAVWRNTGAAEPERGRACGCGQYFQTSRELQLHQLKCPACPAGR